MGGFQRRREWGASGVEVEELASLLGGAEGQACGRSVADIRFQRSVARSRLGKRMAHEWSATTDVTAV